MNEVKSNQNNAEEAPAGVPFMQVRDYRRSADRSRSRYHFTGTSSGVLLDHASQVVVPEKPSGLTDFQRWTAFVTLFALAIYGAARFGDTAFYARLGTDPDTVGLNYGVTLSRAATNIAVAGASVTALFVSGRLHARTKGKRGNQLFYWVTLGAACLLSYLLIVLMITPLVSPVLQIRGFVAVACSLALFWGGSWYEKTGRNISSFDLVSIITIAIGVVVLFGAAAITGYHSASYIMRNQLLPCPCVNLFGYNVTLPWSSGTNGFLGIEASEASVEWIGPGRSAVPRSAILLGNSSSSVVLFDTSTQTILIVPSRDVIVIPRTNLTGWNEI